MNRKLDQQLQDSAARRPDGQTHIEIPKVDCTQMQSMWARLIRDLDRSGELNQGGGGDGTRTTSKIPDRTL